MSLHEVDHQVKFKPLSMSIAGEQGRIIAIGGDKPFLNRMVSMGFTIGCNVMVLANDGKIPLILSVRDANVAISPRDAALIEIEVSVEKV